jgi:hypothetical protein
VAVGIGAVLLQVGDRPILLLLLLLPLLLVLVVALVLY